MRPAGVLRTQSPDGLRVWSRVDRPAVAQSEVSVGSNPSLAGNEPPHAADARGILQGLRRNTRDHDAECTSPPRVSGIPEVPSWDSEFRGPRRLVPSRRHVIRSRFRVYDSVVHNAPSVTASRRPSRSSRASSRSGRISVRAVKRSRSPARSPISPEGRHEGRRIRSRACVVVSRLTV
jgi:hypothetical protein